MNGPLLAELRQELVNTYEPLIDKSRPVVLVDFPSPTNAGDHAIWLGQKALLRHLGITPAYECSLENYDPEAMAAALRDGTILMQGGGNFGDLYVYQRFRMRILADFPNNPAIMFSQSMMFFSTELLKETAAKLAAHGNVTIAARDALSHYKMQKYLGPKTKVLLAPDMALMLDGLKRIHPPKFDIVWLHRDDREAATNLPLQDIAKIAPLEKIRLKVKSGEDGCTVVSGAAIGGNSICITDWYVAEFLEKAGFERYTSWDFDTKSRHWLSWAVSILSLGKVVITERLHGHILALLAGIPHILLNNSYGKNFAFYGTWSREAAGAWISPSPAHALALAQKIAANTENSTAA